MVMRLQICYVFTQKLKLPVPKPAQHTPLWTQVHRIAILIQHLRSSWDYLYAMLAAGQ